MQNTGIREGMKLQVRCETFNLLNHTNFGQITSTREPRRIRIAMKLSF